MTADLFFDSATGYRGQFADGNGERANGQLLDAIEPMLMAEVRSRQRLSRHQVRRCLADRAAKVWISEREIDVTAWCDLVIEIKHPPWTAAAYDCNKRLPASAELRAMLPIDNFRRLWGVRAPVCARLELKGAWIGDDGEVRLGEPPETRERHIREHGWS